MAWNAVKELVDTEERYVNKLKVLETFRKIIVARKILEEDKERKLFVNISPLYLFHTTQLYPQLLKAGKDWERTKRISFVIIKFAPLLKIYSQYSTTYKTAIDVFEKAKKNNPLFAEIVAEFEKLPPSSGMPFQDHFIVPVQRITRYHLVLNEYKKHLSQTDPDYNDTILAYDLVLEAAARADVMLGRWEAVQNLLEMQKELGNSISLLSPGRELIRKDKIQKAVWGTQSDTLTIFLFTDLLLLANEKRIGTAKTIFVFRPLHTQLSENPNSAEQHSFCIQDFHMEDNYFEIFCASDDEKQEWIKALSSVIYGRRTNPATNRETRLECRRCRSTNCRHLTNDSNLFFNPQAPPLPDKRDRRVQSEGIANSQQGTSTSDCVQRSQSMFTSNTQYHSNNSVNKVVFEDSVKIGGVKSYMKVKEDDHIYFYDSQKDIRELSKLPLPICTLTVCDSCTLILSAQGGTYRLKCKSVESQKRLLKVVRKAQILTIPHLIR